MLTATLFSAAAAAIVIGLILRGSVARFEPVRSHGLGPFSVELRRRVFVHGHPNGMGGHAFAQPCEDRIRVFRVAGVAVWRQLQSCELPTQVTGMISSLTARDFDSEFDAPFRLATFAMLAPPWAARLGLGRNGGPASP